jgi:hypothetical protein
VRSVSGSFERPYGILRINTSFVAYTSLIEAYLPAFLARYPQIDVEVSLEAANHRRRIGRAVVKRLTAHPCHQQRCKIRSRARSSSPDRLSDAGFSKLAAHASKKSPRHDRKVSLRIEETAVRGK